MDKRICVYSQDGLLSTTEDTNAFELSAEWSKGLPAEAFFWTLSVRHGSSGSPDGWTDVLTVYLADPPTFSQSDRFARVVDQGNGKIVTLTPEQKKLFADVLVSRYPALSDDDEEMNGGDTVDTLTELYADLNDADQSFVVAVNRG